MTGKAVCEAVQGEKEATLGPTGVVCVVVVDDHWNSKQGTQWLGDDIGGDEVAVEDIRPVRKQTPWDRGEIEGK